MIVTTIIIIRMKVIKKGIMDVAMMTITMITAIFFVLYP